MFVYIVFYSQVFTQGCFGKFQTVNCPDCKYSREVWGSALFSICTDLSRRLIVTAFGIMCEFSHADTHRQTGRNRADI